MVFFTEQDVDRLVGMADALEAVEQAFALAGRGQAASRPRQRVGGSGHGWLMAMVGAMPAWGLMGFKAYVAGPKGARFMVFLFDSATAQPLAAIEAGRLGQLRTGAASGVASRHMARPDSRVMALIGAGAQAETQLEAVASVLRLERVWVTSRTPERAEAFCRRMEAKVPGVELKVAHDPQRAVGEADVVTTITTSRSPVVQGRWLRPGTHVNAAGSNHPARQELDVEAVLRCGQVVVDDLEQARQESGDLIAAARAGFDWGQVQELARVVAGSAPGRTQAHAITLFESQGVAVEDVALAARVLEKAGAWRRPDGTAGAGAAGPGGAATWAEAWPTLPLWQGRWP